MYLQEKRAEWETGNSVGGNPVAGAGSGVRTFGRYRLEREIGRGCSSIVYAAHDAHRDRAVALKVLTLPHMPNAERKRDLEERFRREAQAISSLSHPNIVAVYDAGQGEDGRQFIAMEHLPGETLRRRLMREATLSMPATVAIGVRVAEALHYAHGRGIVHRDVKPDNIFLAHHGPEMATPKLMDFGVAHVLSDSALTQDGMIIGSPAYMSPEQINGLPPDARTDVFALAVTLAETAAGVKPFEAETLPALMQKILHHDPDLRAVADRRLQRVLAKALSKKPGARYPDAGAFAQALRRLAPFAVPAPGIATQRLSRSAFGAAPARPRRLSRLSAVGFGGLVFASLALLPFWVGHPPQTAPRVASVDPVRAASVLPPRPDRRVDRGRVVRGVKRQAPISIRDATPAYTLRHTEGDNFVVRIVENKPSMIGKPGAGVFPRPSRTPAIRLTPPASPPNARRLAAHRPASRAPKPVIRVAAALQEQVPDHREPDHREPDHREPDQTAPRATDPRAAVPPTDAPPTPLYRPMPLPVDDLDLTDTTIRVRLSVNERGEVTEAYILQPSGSRALDDAALDAVGHWQYAPAVRDGKPVPGVAIETVTFAP